MTPPLDQRGYVLPQGPTATVLGNRHLITATARYLDAHMEVVDATPGDGWTIRSSVPGARPPAGVPVDSFGETYRIAMLAGGGMVIAHPGTPDQYWKPADRSVAIDAPPGAHGYAMVQSTYTAARRIALLSAARGGMTVLHAAAVSLDGRGVLICGRKGAGKTTLALALLGRGAGYLASDRVIAWTDHQGPAAGGWVGTFRIDPHSLSMALDSVQSRNARRYVADHRRIGVFRYAGKCRFPPADLLDICGASPAYRVAPRLLIELDPNAADPSGELRADPLTRDSLLATWRAHAVAGDARFVPGSIPPAEAVPPRGLTGIRLVGRRPPLEMAALVEAMAARLAPCE